MIQESARQYAQESLFPKVTEAYRNESVDKTVIQSMGGKLYQMHLKSFRLE